MKLIFTNNNQIDVENISSITKIYISSNSLSQLEEILDNFTEENMLHVTLNDTVYVSITPLSYEITKKDITDNEIIAVVTCRKQTELERMAAEITELQEALAELQGGLE